MPSERSLYRKMQIILDYCQAGKHSNIDELQDLVIRHSPLNFIYHRRDPKTKEVLAQCSSSSIKAAIRLCIDLYLISAPLGKITPLGVSATDPRRFSRIIGKQVSDSMANHQVPVERIIDVINNELLRRNPPVAPTADQIWEALGIPMSLRYFRRLMHLLGQSAILQVSQQRIYLPR